MKMSFLANRGGEYFFYSTLSNLFEPLKPHGAFCARVRHAATALTAVAAFVVPITIAACGEDSPSTDPSRTPDDLASRAMTREDSIRAGLIIMVDTAWDGEDHYTF